MSTAFPGFADVAGAARLEACAVRDFVAALFGALLVLIAALARRALSLLPDFAFTDRAALLLAEARDAEDAGADLRFLDALDPAGALPFFATVRDDLLFAFLRAAMAKTLHARGFGSGENPAGDKSPDC